MRQVSSPFLEWLLLLNFTEKCFWFKLILDLILCVYYIFKIKFYDLPLKFGFIIIFWYMMIDYYKVRSTLLKRKIYRQILKFIPIRNYMSKNVIVTNNSVCFLCLSFGKCCAAAGIFTFVLQFFSKLPSKIQSPLLSRILKKLWIICEGSNKL